MLVKKVDLIGLSPKGFNLISHSYNLWLNSKFKTNIYIYTDLIKRVATHPSEEITMTNLENLKAKLLSIKIQNKEYVYK